MYLKNCLLLDCDSNLVNVNFFKSGITYLEHIMSKDGIEADPKKVTAIKEWLVPKTVMESAEFFGFYQLLSQIYTKVHPHSMTYQSVSVWRKC